MKLYTKTICPKCMFVKSFLKEAGFEGKYELINVDTDEQAKQEIVEAGFLSVPILELNGELIQDVAQMNEEISKIAI
ncbi:glutaredoxin family protein [Rummeliibacillus suwonensis]|uniref:glutaredoxin family protein n=1 Tax=Rummeliibacillus suwonensis TaxID=1306154 RepID=UPI0011B4BE07|nr:glutaredoxin [Rummeliibacillus suwonensis]MBO2536684.1 glutaredoxin [Rummeliibacillus suwonensis]